MRKTKAITPVVTTSTVPHWNPISEMEQMHNRLAALMRFDPFRLLQTGKEENFLVAEWSPRVDILEDEKEMLVKAELPEMTKDDVKVTVDEGVLTISGERKFEREQKGKTYHRVEREYGTFVRSFTLPSAVDAEKVSADFKDGVLKVHLPKDTKAHGKAVEVKVG